MYNEQKIEVKKHKVRMNDKEDRNRRQVDGMKCEEEQRWVFHTFKQDFEQ